jgi:signal transduction histidine kinase
VTDTGTGIEPGNLDRIFEPFFTTKGEGMGLGLSICRSIVEAHGGRLSASQHKSDGTIFHLTLPLAAT